MNVCFWLCFVFFILSSTTFAAETQSPFVQLKSPEIHKHKVNEPIFEGQVFVLEAGMDNPSGVLLIHGLGNEASGTWHKLIPQLAASYHVIAVDLPGFGQSEKQNKLYSPTQYAAFLKWVVDRYLHKPLVVIGHSLGGALAIKYVATYPHGVTKLILVDVAGILHRRVYSREVGELEVREQTSKLPIPQPRFDKIVGHIISILPEVPIALNLILNTHYLRNKVLAGDPSKIAALALIEEDFSKDLRQINIPCHIFWGSHDIVTPLRTGILLKAVIPNATLELVPEAGHVPMLERPDFFNQAIFTAITTLPSSEPTITAEKHNVGECTNEDGMIFSGEYDRIEISGCRDVFLQDVTCGHIDIKNSDVVFMGGSLKSQQTALSITNSSVKATGIKIEADNAIVASRSRLDLAGAELIAKSTAITSPDQSKVVFSVSHIKSSLTNGFIHDYITVTATNPL